MRVRSSSAPTVRRRPNQRALSMASAAGSTKPAEQLDVAAGEVVGLAVLDGHEADDRPAGREHGVEARRRAGRDARAAVGEEVLLAHQAAQPQRPGAAGGGGRPGRCVLGGRVPSRRSVCQRSSVSSSTRRATASNSNSSLQLRHGGVEHLVEVERGRQGLGDLVELEQQGVGVGEPPEAVQGEDLALVGLAGDAAGVAGHEGHEEHLHRPLRPRCAGRPRRSRARAPTGA